MSQLDVRKRSGTRSDTTLRTHPFDADAEWRGGALLAQSRSAMADHEVISA